jgi:hypothetical protein
MIVVQGRDRLRCAQGMTLRYRATMASHDAQRSYFR